MKNSELYESSDKGSVEKKNEHIESSSDKPENQAKEDLPISDAQPDPQSSDVVADPQASDTKDVSLPEKESDETASADKEVQVEKGGALKENEASEEHPVSDVQPESEESDLAAAPTASDAKDVSLSEKDSDETASADKEVQVEKDKSLKESEASEELSDNGISAEEVEAKKKDKVEIDIEIVAEQETTNYILLSREDLVKELEELLNNQSFEQIRRSVSDIKHIFYDKLEKEIAEKKERFITEGGLEQDFKPAEDPSEMKLNELLNKFRSIKADYAKQMEGMKEENLAKKEEILEEFRLLMEGQDNFDNTFRKFKQLQKRWFDIGQVPQQNVKDLWNSYNFFVDKFNDFINLNKELKELDFKKNLDLKIKLCERAEELAKESNIASAFKTLQKYHTQWREIGPVPREDKDSIWERFKAATSVVNHAHQKYQSEMKDSLIRNLELKQDLCEKAEALLSADLLKHQEWVEKTNEMLSLQDEWKTIGYAPKKDNNQIYARFRKACDAFFEKKADFYSETFEHQKENLKKKEALIAEAESIKDSDDWKGATRRLIELQKRWKEVGPVPRKESDRLWRRFRGACDHFFNKKSEFYSTKDSSYDDNLKAKLALIEEMKSYTPSSDKKQVLDELENFQYRYNEIGFVPVEVKDKIRDDFKDGFNAIIEKLELSENDKSLLRFRYRIASLLNNPRAENKLHYERDKLLNKLQQLKNDIGVWENNIGFFKQTKSSEDTINGFNDKIEEAKGRIENLEQKILIIDELEDE